MKAKHFLILSLFSGVSLAIPSLDLKKEHKKEPCECYCSVKCGPRKKRPGIDKPFTKVIDGKEICFCQERDLRLYKPNKCKYKEGELKNNCCDLKK